MGSGERQAPVPGGRNPVWWVAGVLLVLVIVALGYPVLMRSSGAGVPGGNGGSQGMGGAEADGRPVDLNAMSLEDQATILFNRVMSSNSAGDTADVAFFLPKALIIHEQLNPTDPDGLYHFALLLMVGEDFEAALGKAREGLAQVPDYLLLLAVGGEASVALRDTSAARDFYTRFLEVYDVEMGLMRSGYEHHQPILPAYREEAAGFLGRG
jgi:tetratricopeptide (TPR) repeat protein